MRSLLNVIGALMLFVIMFPSLIAFNTFVALFDYIIFLIRLPANAYIKSYEMVSKIKVQDGSDIR